MVSSNPAPRPGESPGSQVVVKEKPLKWCSIPLSDVLARGKRLEASVFNVEAKQARETLAHCRYGTVPFYGEQGLVKNATYPGRFKRIYCEKGNGVGFYLPTQIAEIYPKPEKYISGLTKCDLSELELKPNTLLLTRSGTIGTVACVSETIAGKVFSDDVIRITFKEPYDLGYAYAFLKTKAGNIALQTNGYGSVITHLEPEHLLELQIPNAPVAIRQRIHDLVERSFALRDESNALLDRATSLLVTGLQLPDVGAFDVGLYKKDAPVDTFSVRLSDLSGRLDASYHVPIVDAIVGHLQKHAAEVTTVGDPRISKAVILPGRFKRVYVEEGYGRVLLGGKQLYELDPANKKYLSAAKHDRLFKTLEVSENTTLITRSGTIGKVALVPKHWEHWIPSDHIIRVVPASPEIAGYLNVFLASEYGFRLITRFTYGSVVDEIDDNHVRCIPIPLLKDRAAQTQINDLALAANRKRYEAYRLEQEALRIMDDEVIHAK